MFDEYYPVSDVARKLGKSETQIWSDINEGRLSVVVPAEITGADGHPRFNYVVAPREVILRMRASKADLIEWENYGGRCVAQSKPDMILVLTRDRNASSFETAVYWIAAERTASASIEDFQTNDKPWLQVDPRDPPPEQPWYTPARYFARELVKSEPTLVEKRDILARKVASSLTKVGVLKRGGIKPLDPATVKKAFVNVTLG